MNRHEDAKRLVEHSTLPARGRRLAAHARLERVPRQFHERLLILGRQHHQIAAAM
jgi:hypothetical protein